MDFNHFVQVKLWSNYDIKTLGFQLADSDQWFIVD